MLRGAVLVRVRKKKGGGGGGGKRNVIVLWAKECTEKTKTKKSFTPERKEWGGITNQQETLLLKYEEKNKVRDLKGKRTVPSRVVVKGKKRGEKG